MKKLFLLSVATFSMALIMASCNLAVIDADKTNSNIREAVEKAYFEGIYIPVTTRKTSF